MYYDKNDKPTGNLIIDLKRVADLAGEPVTLTEAKTQLRVTFTDDDTEITALITKARKRVENYCNISIVYQRIQMIGALSYCQDLPYGPVIGIESVATNTGDTGSGPIAYTNFDVNWDSTGNMFNVPTGAKYQVTYTAGMSSCPADLKDTILQVLTFLYENRGKVIDVTGVQQVLSNADAYKKLNWI
jgi:uncharacterized phiE125 gp8 family phage protein